MGRNPRPRLFGPIFEISEKVPKADKEQQALMCPSDFECKFGFPLVMHVLGHVKLSDDVPVLVDHFLVLPKPQNPMKNEKESASWAPMLMIPLLILNSKELTDCV